MASAYVARTLEAIGPLLTAPPSLVRHDRLA